MAAPSADRTHDELATLPGGTHEEAGAAERDIGGARTIGSLVEPLET